MLDFASLKASDVLQAMVSGLLKSKDDPLFEVNMGTFGTVKKEICYGCCATVALAEIFGKGKSASEMMLAYVKTLNEQPDFIDAYLSNVIELEPSSVQGSLTLDELENLECSVNYARVGYVSQLIKVLTGEIHESFNCRWCLDSHNWEKQLPVVQATIAEMIKAGY